MHRIMQYFESPRKVSRKRLVLFVNFSEIVASEHGNIWTKYYSKENLKILLKYQEENINN